MSFDLSGALPDSSEVNRKRKEMASAGKKSATSQTPPEEEPVFPSAAASGSSLGKSCKEDEGGENEPKPGPSSSFR